jgi:hypothetical protein
LKILEFLDHLGTTWKNLGNLSSFRIKSFSPLLPASANIDSGNFGISQERLLQRTRERGERERERETGGFLNAGIINQKDQSTLLKAPEQSTESRKNSSYFYSDFRHYV